MAIFGAPSPLVTVQPIDYARGSPPLRNLQAKGVSYRYVVSAARLADAKLELGPDRPKASDAG